MIYLDNAATTGLKPTPVIAAVKNALVTLSANPGRSGHIASVKAADMVFKTRQKTSDFFGADGPENVIFTMNCTHSANCILKGVLKRGDHVIVSSLEHNAIMRPLVKTGVSYSVAEVSLDDERRTIMEFERCIKPNTRLVFCTAASNVIGKILPIGSIGRLCRERGILFAVDAAQAAGVIPINMKEMNIDYLCVAPHKGLYAPMGVGILVARKNIRETVLEGGTGTNSAELVQPESLPERLESGTLNVPAIAGISAGIDYVNSIGLNKIMAHESKLIKKLYEKLSANKRIRLYTPLYDIHSYAPLLVFNVKGFPSFSVADELSKNGIAVRAGLHCAPMAHRQIGTLSNGAVRVSVGVFNTEYEINTLINLLESENFLKNVEKAIE